MKQFIKTIDKPTADRLINAGFNLVSQVGTTYTFLNQLPTNFNFEIIDKKKIAYTDRLTF